MASDVLSSFQPAYWDHYISHPDECFTKPNITLGRLDVAYEYEGLARDVVLANLTGLYQMSRTNQVITDCTGLNLSAKMFVARNSACTMYGMMLYFSLYMTDYKVTMKDFDFSDILHQYRNKFVPWWNNRVGLSTQVKPQEEEGPVGVEAEMLYLEKSASQGKDLTKGGIYLVGDAKIRKHIDSLMEKYKDARKPF